MLFIFITSNLLIVIGLDSYLSFNTEKLNKEDVIDLIPLPSLILLSTIILNGLFTSEFKYKLVFLKTTNPLPGSRLQKVLENDDRFSINQVIEKFGPIPDNPKEQNIYWYQRIFSPNQNSEKVLDTHRNFLLMRDLTAICVVFILYSILNTLVFSGTWIYVIIFLIEYLIIRLVAVNYGNRLVTTTVAESIH